jgi:hypothetical protein
MKALDFVEDEVGVGGPHSICPFTSRYHAIHGLNTPRIFCVGCSSRLPSIVTALLFDFQ